uniref:Anaphase-promoting complex subunit 10 n=1 Tax=Calidris pygmaea TaxID=425635 RepID=A0A8C3KEG0_9CHAR
MNWNDTSKMCLECSKCVLRTQNLRVCGTSYLKTHFLFYFYIHISLYINKKFYRHAKMYTNMYVFICINYIFCKLLHKCEAKELKCLYEQRQPFNFLIKLKRYQLTHLFSFTRMTTPNKTPPGADPKQLERTGTVREIGSQAVWSLSSCKPGFGVDQLRDDNLETYWQSDGSQPHLVNIQFRRKTTVKTLCIYADYKSDESYTPSKISVRVGNNFHNLQEIRQLELVEPSGWIHVPLTDTHKKPIRTFMIQIAVLANHQNGRDTHMRQIKVYTPVEESSIGKFPRCTTIDFMMYRSIR